MAPIATTLVPETKSNANVGALGRTKDGRPLKIRSYPKFDSLEEERLYRKQHLAAAYRIFAERGFDEGVAGHISVRDPILTDHFYIRFRLDIGHDQPINAAAFAIHSEIHKARPNVHAACRAHSVYGKAFSVFGRELDMITQDSLRFYKNHAVYPQFGGVVLDREEGRRIASHLGDGKAIILQNHGLLTVGETVDAAAFWFLSLDKTCHAQLLCDAVERGSGHQKTYIPDEEARYSYQQVGTPEKGWLAFQPYFDDILAKTNGSFLK
ncbi:4-hydroxy-3-prenylphenylpyruvate oxygenase/4-hydroxy-3-prenylbenzoate synthase [Pseudocercospora fuligena]|uniref:4-hydroxy-3-prenylphenylpyruvate oxygenase/4-hydroxy-3-prenylbenzoate synthase n=1 Tax=Pseudocercospora fuligena TaxID=685502 RepID=A0A8H6VLM6_9PEZI|nr:4-hydroxy-3-prenylphenylpyruvate oxygenase/4-hydroxy-3-prenylbenzoate synthase [Pseudocercospora fuligena]